ncbi:hypothetical protein F5878DRAFT_713047 [Lentinula raphanica]|uniref:Uncharacterized protein n=1 Tax=Lentinula raphanica TaxID=153919 RepID=A0AA38P052_9AGAR|nr:hypothetical protein F5878DRAFT_713047 [Lentinula raphanica]
MYLFRNIFMRGSLAVHVLLLLIIATAIALPMSSSTKSSEKPQKRAGKKARPDVTVPSTSNARTLKKLKMAGSGFNEAGPSGSINFAIAEAFDAKSFETPSKPQELIIAVIIEGGEKLWTRGEEVSSQANWFMAMLPVEQLANIDDDSDEHRVRVVAYRTIRDMASHSNYKWARQHASNRLHDVYGRQVELSKNYLILEIARVTTKIPISNIRHSLARSMRNNFYEYRSDKLPNVPSIYQSLILLHNATLHEPGVAHVEPEILNVSKSSDFGKAFYQMVEKKGTGVGQELSVEQKWEWELYERITSGDVNLETSLWKHKNHDILEDLWDEVYEVPRELLHGQDIDLDPKWKDSESWGNVLDETFDPSGHH